MGMRRGTFTTFHNGHRDDDFSSVGPHLRRQDSTKSICSQLTPEAFADTVKTNASLTINGGTSPNLPVAQKPSGNVRKKHDLRKPKKRKKHDLRKPSGNARKKHDLRKPRGNARKKHDFPSWVARTTDAAGTECWEI